MTDGDKVRIREAFEVVKLAAQKAKPDTVNGASFVAAVAALGWVLEESAYANLFEAYLKEIRSMLPRRVQG